MKYLVILVVMCVVIYGNAAPSGASNLLTYDELVQFNPTCENKDAQLKQLNHIKTVKNFPADPDDIKNEMDRAYNSRLKATIWWYTYRCEQ